MKIIKILILVIIIPLFSLYSYEKYVDFDLIKKPGPPRFIKNGILFTLPGDQWNKVFLRTSLDNWQKDFYYQLNYYDVLFVFIPYNGDTKLIKYKINYNGFWEIDPLNPDYITDDLNIKLSVIKIPEEEKYYEELPYIEETDEKLKNVMFKYYDQTAKEVNLVCSIDNWNQYSHIMSKNRYGHWEITKHFANGNYYYYFLVDGKKVCDVQNKKVVWDDFKGEVSYFQIN